jgi:nucleoside triphosphate diphosphatase
LAYSRFGENDVSEVNLGARQATEFDAPMQAIALLLQVMARLRDPLHGCPWDIEQNFASVAPYTLEEAYEVVDAIARNHLPDLQAELGDLLLQVVFHAQMAAELGEFDFAAVVNSINKKMLRRHPHVDFTDLAAAIASNGLAQPAPAIARGDSAAQTVRWKAIKAQEKAERGETLTKADSILDGVPRGLSEWQRALQLQQKAAEHGFDWPGISDVIDKLHEEVDEFKVEVNALPQDAEKMLDELGDVLFVLVNAARHLKLDPAEALRRCNLKFERRYRFMESLAHARGITLSALDLTAQDGLWNEAKRVEKLR